MEILKTKIDDFEVAELACKILGIDYEAIDGDISTIEDSLQDAFYIDFDIFKEIISRLLPLITVAESALTDEIFKGFADVENKVWLVKTEVK